MYRPPAQHSTPNRRTVCTWRPANAVPTVRRSHFFDTG